MYVTHQRLRRVPASQRTLNTCVHGIVPTLLPNHACRTHASSAINCTARASRRQHLDGAHYGCLATTIYHPCLYTTEFHDALILRHQNAYGGPLIAASPCHDTLNFPNVKEMSDACYLYNSTIILNCNMYHMRWIPLAHICQASLFTLAIHISPHETLVRSPPCLTTAASSLYTLSFSSARVTKFIIKMAIVAAIPGMTNVELKLVCKTAAE